MKNTLLSVAWPAFILTGILLVCPVTAETLSINAAPDLVIRGNTF
jgi:hypothetical protein